MPEFAPGDVFVNHRIEGLAGRGGMGVVYRAIDLDLDRTVALKVIAPALADDPDFRARFVAESKAAASIEHPHVIPVYYAGEREGVLFIVMRYVDGPDLRALVRAEGRLDEGRAARVVAQVGGALDAAHSHGLVHRDVKPANVLLGAEDHAYLTDFGLTKRAASTAGLSRTGGWVGTLGFVAPEQIRGERVDARTDVYALGCVLVHALTGGPPFVRDSDEATLWAHLHAPPPVDRVPEAFAGLVERALAKDPEDRFPSAGDLGRAALAAAGETTAPGPERNVARGDAAPEGTPQTAATERVSIPAFEGETHVSPPDDDPTGPTAKAGGRPPLPGRRRALVAGAAAVLVVGALLAVLLGGGDDGSDTASTPGTTTTTTPVRTRGPAQVGPSIPIASRPNSIAYAGGRVWALSTQSGEIVVLDAPTSDVIRRIRIGGGGSAVAGGFKSVWAVKRNTRALIRIDAKTLRRIGTTRVGAPGQQPVSLAIGEGAVWVGLRKPTANRDGTGETVVRVDPSTSGQQAVTVPGGVESVAVGEGAAWVTNLTRNRVVRVDVDDLEYQKAIRVGRRPKGVAVGEGAVWVANTASRTVTRINPGSYERKTIALKASPRFVSTGGGSVWLTATEANRLIRVDAKTRKVRERIKTGDQPFALDVTPHQAVWLTLLAGNAVQRVRFYR